MRTWLATMQKLKNARFDSSTATEPFSAPRYRLRCSRSSEVGSGSRSNGHLMCYLSGSSPWRTTYVAGRVNSSSASSGSVTIAMSVTLAPPSSPAGCCVIPVSSCSNFAEHYAPARAPTLTRFITFTSRPPTKSQNCTALREIPPHSLYSLRLTNA